MTTNRLVHAGFDQFRENQEEAILAALQGNSPCERNAMEIEGLHFGKQHSRYEP